MRAGSLSLAQRWKFAAKPASWPKLLTPFLLGQAIGVAGGGTSPKAFLFGLVFTVLDLLFIVFANDWGDRDVDAIKRRMFPKQTSPKTIPDGILPATHLLLAAIAAASLAVAVAFLAEHALHRPGLGLLGVAAVAVFVAYTLPPLQLNYRGGGELLEALGVGVALPWMQSYLASGSILSPGLVLLPGFGLFALASAIASGLADERSDRRGGKTTFVTLFGNRAARRASEALVLAGAGAWALAGLVGPLSFWVGVIPALVAVFYGVAMRRRSEAARTDAFAAQRVYKEALHFAIWRGALVAGMLLVWWHVVLGGR